MFSNLDLYLLYFQAVVPVGVSVNIFVENIIRAILGKSVARVWKATLNSLGWVFNVVFCSL